MWNGKCQHVPVLAALPKDLAHVGLMGDLAEDSVFANWMLVMTYEKPPVDAGGFLNDDKTDKGFYMLHITYIM
jgi:hypothetical protein